MTEITFYIRYKKRQDHPTRGCLAVSGVEYTNAKPNLTCPGFLSGYIKELESGGVITPEQGSELSMSAAQVRKLDKAMTELQAEDKRLKTKLDV